MYDISNDSFPISSTMRSLENFIEHASFSFSLSLSLLFLTSIGNMQECQEKARDLMRPGMENDANQISKVEQKLISCMSKQVDDHIKMLRTMKDRCVVTLVFYARTRLCVV